jgi:hypothetical protein
MIVRPFALSFDLSDENLTERLVSLLNVPAPITNQEPFAGYAGNCVKVDALSLQEINGQDLVLDTYGIVNRLIRVTYTFIGLDGPLREETGSRLDFRLLPGLDVADPRHIAELVRKQVEKVDG